MCIGFIYEIRDRKDGDAQMMDTCHLGLGEFFFFSFFVFFYAKLIIYCVYRLYATKYAMQMSMTTIMGPSDAGTATITNT